MNKPIAANKAVTDMWSMTQMLVEEAVLAEREACIKLVHAGTGEPVQTKTLVILQKERKRIADAIQARGEKA